MSGLKKCSNSMKTGLAEARVAIFKFWSEMTSEDGSEVTRTLLLPPRTNFVIIYIHVLLLSVLLLSI